MSRPTPGAELTLALGGTLLLFFMLFFLDVGDVVRWPRSWNGVQQAVSAQEVCDAFSPENLSSSKATAMSSKKPSTGTSRGGRSKTPGERGRRAVMKWEEASKKGSDGRAPGEVHDHLVGPAARSPCVAPNTNCYEEMFAEAPRLTFGGGNFRPALFSRPGNCYSNFVYVFVGLYLILALYPSTTLLKISDFVGTSNILSTTSSFDETVQSAGAAPPFLLSDLLFAIVLVTLGVFSVMWHGSHYNRIQLLDLAAMDFCIAYCIIRLLCMALAAPIVRSSASAALLVFLTVTSSNAPSSSSTVLLEGATSSFAGMAKEANLLKNSSTADDLRSSGQLCLGVCLIFLTYLFHQRETMHGELSRECPFSGRRRLVRGEIDIAGACVYLVMPVVYFTLPILLQRFVFLDSGSSLLGTAAGTTLSVGWNYRFSERFCLDGNPVMRWLWGVRVRVWRRRAAAGAMLVTRPVEKTGVAGSSSSFRALLGVVRRKLDVAATETLLGVGSCVFSPTAVLHWMTGLTLLFAYAHCRTIEAGMVDVV